MMMKGREGRRNSSRSRRPWKALCALACVLFMVLSANPAPGATDNDDGTRDVVKDYVPGELLIKFKDKAKADSVKKVKESLKAKELKSFKSCGAKHWKLGKGVTVEKALKDLEKHQHKDSIEYAEPNYYYYAHATPTASYRGSLWGMHNFGQTGGTADADIDALEMWQSYTDASNVVVGVIDTGVDYTHDDLKNNIWVNTGETGTDGNGDDKKTNGVDDDGNGYVDDHRGWDFVNDDNDPMDDNGHGTHTSGTIGAEGDNGVGVAGACWDVNIMPLKFLNSGGRGSTDDAILAVDYAAWFKDGSGDNVVRITSNSWGGGRKSKTLEKAITNSGALFIASAGNSGSSRLQYPAGYTCDNIISVAATDHDDALASFSNYGSSWVDLGAPGVDILSCQPSNGYGFKDGTSMAAPHVSGVAAMVMAKNPSWSLAQVKSQIMDTGDTLSSLSGKTVSGRRLNAYSAVGGTDLGSDTTAPSTVGDLALSDASFTSMKVSWSAPGDDGTTGTAWLYDIRYSTSAITASNWDSATQVAFEPGPESYGTSQSMVVTGLDDGTTYHFAIRTYDEMGNLAALSNVPSSKTLVSAWDSYPLNNDVTAGRFNFAYDNNGAPAFIYKDELADPRDVYFAKMDRTDNSWTVSKVTSCMGGGIDLAFDGNNDPGFVTYADGKVLVGLNDGTSWSIHELEPRKAGSDYISIAFSGTTPGVAYYLGGPKGGLIYATYDGSSWTKTVVEKAGARYIDLEYDGNGDPGIAYSDNNYGGDAMLDSMMYAKWDGSKWNIQEVEGNAWGYGVFCDLAFDSNDYPRLVHSNTDSGVRYLEWDPSQNEFVLDIVGSAEYAGYTGITLTSTDVPYVCYLRNNNVEVGYWSGTSWTIEVIDTGITSGRGLFIDHYEDGSGNEFVGIGYQDSDKLFVVEKTL